MIIKILEISGTFLAEDFVLLENFEKKRISPVKEIISSTNWENCGVDLDDLNRF